MKVMWDSCGNELLVGKKKSQTTQGQIRRKREI